MFSKEITTSDIFVDMPATAQLLYFHLGMEADDDGFLGNARMLSRAYGSNTDDLKLLIAKGFLIAFPNGVTVIKDWNINNQIRKDRYKPTIYLDEKATLFLDVRGTYAVSNVDLATNGKPNGNQMETQYRLGKDSIGKDSIGENKEKKDAHSKASKKEEQKLAYGEFKNVWLTDKDFNKLKEKFPNDYQERIEKLSSYIASKGKDNYKNHYATITNWASKEAPKQPNKTKEDPAKRII